MPAGKETDILMMMRLFRYLKCFSQDLKYPSRERRRPGADIYMSRKKEDMRGLGLTLDTSRPDRHRMPLFPFSIFVKLIAK